MQLQTAKEWGITPDEFFRKDKKTKAEMIATVDVERLMDAYYADKIHAATGQTTTTTKRK